MESIEEALSREKIVVASGYFDPIHVGHIEFLETARSIGSKLIVIVNNDKQAALKKGKSFMPESDRAKIVGSLKCVDRVVISADKDSTVCKTLSKLKTEWLVDVFANGGDRKEEEIPEARTCRLLGIEMVDGLGEKIRSSSEFIKQK